MVLVEKISCNIFGLDSFERSPRTFSSIGTLRNDKNFIFSFFVRFKKPSTIVLSLMPFAKIDAMARVSFLGIFNECFFNK